MNVMYIVLNMLLLPLSLLISNSSFSFDDLLATKSAAFRGRPVYMKLNFDFDLILLSLALSLFVTS